MPSGPRLSGSRISLRALTGSDVTQRYLGWLNDPAVNRFLETRHQQQSVNAIEAFVEAKNASADEWLFGIFVDQPDPHIGNVKLGPVRARHRLGEVSLFAGDRLVWGKGYATEAIALVTAYGFEQLGLNKLTASMYAENEGSVRAFERAGWQREARLKDHYIHDGAPMDLIVVGCRACDDAWRRRAA